MKKKSMRERVVGEETFSAMPDPSLAGQVNMNELRQLFELAPFSIGMFDRPFRYLSIHQTLADLNGLSREGYYSKYMREIVPT
ncbi:hypothetical protein, partial [Aeromonas hydrophila]|uniref:hypothetical protein n=1 Tax=Aeromonas hydrophila TaxID=644 RepID=UPI0035A330BD